MIVAKIVESQLTMNIFGATSHGAIITVYLICDHFPRFRVIISAHIITVDRSVWYYKIS